MDIREKILQASDIESIPMHVDEWDTDILISTFTLEQRATLLNLLHAMPDDNVDFKSLYPLVIVYGVRHPKSREPLFTEDDSDALGKKNGTVIERIGLAILEHNGLGKDSGAGVDEAKKE